MLPRELIRRIRRLEIATRQVVSALLAGQYHSVFKGRGMAFSEVRPYQAGDDIRWMDWNVTARTSSPHVKVFTEERELTVVLRVDVPGDQAPDGPLRRLRLPARRLRDAAPHRADEARRGPGGAPRPDGGGLPLARAGGGGGPRDGGSPAGRLLLAGRADGVRGGGGTGSRRAHPGVPQAGARLGG